MSIESELRKEGIEVIKPLDTLTLNTIAKTVANSIIKSFPEQGLNYDDLFIKLSRLNMFVAKMPQGVAQAKYYYKNSSIYFSDNIDFSNIDSFATHECIHYLQEKRDENYELLSLGLCDFTDSKLPGMALNEASVQFMSSIALNEKVDSVKYFDITFPTNSPYYYALECNLIKQMAYVTGEYELINSTLYSNDNFKEKFISLTSKKTFFKVQNNFDKLMELEDTLSNNSLKLGDNDISIKMINKIENEISNLRHKINELFINTQNLILTSYFDKNISALADLDDIDNYRKKLYNYKDLIGTTDNYTFFNEYYVQKMAELEKVSYAFENNEELALVPIKRNLFSIIIGKIKSLFKHNNYENEERTTF